jgi:hypothetical protein
MIHHAKRYTALLGIVICGALAVACGTTITRDRDVAAPQPYRPPSHDDQWQIAGALETEVHRSDASGAITFSKRTLIVNINDERVIEGELPMDDVGNSTGTLDGSYRGAKVHADCSSQQKSRDWIEVRCRIMVNGEHAVTLIM